MRLLGKHPTKKWEVSIISFEDEHGNGYKVTRHIPAFSVSDTKLFRTKEDAKKQFEKWLN